MQNRSVPRKSHIISSYDWMRFQNEQHRPKKKKILPAKKTPNNQNTAAMKKPTSYIILQNKLDISSHWKV